MSTTYKNKKNNLGSNMKTHIRKEFTEVARELSQIKSKPKKKNRMNKSIAVSGRSSRLKLATGFSAGLLDPFNPNTEGIRVPDIYSFPTEVYHSHGTFTLRSDGSGNFGGFFLPNPDVSFVDTNLDSGGLSCVAASSMTLLPTKAYGGTGFSNTAAYSASVLNNYVSSYRVSSWGIKITNLQAALSATGKLYIAIVPTVASVPCSTELTQMTGNSLTTAYLTQGNVSSADILGLPLSRQIEVSELMTGSIIIPGRVLNPTFYNFKSVNKTGQINSGDYFSNSSTNQGTSYAYGNNDIASTPGGVNIIIFAEGMPINTNALSVEYIYHFEGTPLLNTNQALPVVSGGKQTNCGDSQIVEHSLNAVNDQPPFRFVTEVEQMAGNVFGLASKAYDASQTPVGRAVTSALMALF